MKQELLQAGYASWDFKDCKQAGKSSRYYKNKAHRKLRRSGKKELLTIQNDS